ncbi:MAG TPA: NfeD family protein [Acidobacteriota bacterium]|nr:NfeD family protein [Acidobacteriota bacterium]HNB72093.1 NfeD family protein [Acidobacteriota bacterium]HND20547.1 NfeD family protein [Acidobacteriota bacterium]HNG91984.1 NfeD family protein [Acidobacteriota bacterium]HNH84163.1 NfeD family protein [Acidobacteriota bacterium]
MLWIIAGGGLGSGLFFCWVLIRGWIRKQHPDLGFTAGDCGITESALVPFGYVWIAGEIWPAQASTPIPAGVPVRFIGVDGIRLCVECVSPKSQKTSRSQTR